MKHAAMLRPFLAAMAAFFFLAGSVFAQAVPVPRVVFPLSPVGNVVTVGPLTADASNAARFSFGAASNGAVFASAPSSMPTPGGASVPLTVVGNVPKATVAAALGRFARKALPILSTGVALYDLGEELGFGLDNSSGSMSVTRVVLGTSGSWRYSAATPAPTKEAACQNYVTYYQALSGGSTISDPVVNADNSCTVKGYYAPSNYTYYSTAAGYFTAGAPPTTEPSTLDAFDAAILAKSDYGSTSALGRAFGDALASGESAQVTPSTVTGPATSPGPSTTAVNSSAGTTTTNQTTNHYSYAGNTVTTNVVTVTTTTNNSTGAVVSSSSSTTAPEVPAQPSPFEMLCGVPGVPACSVTLADEDPEALNTDQGKDAVKDILDFVQDPASKLPQLPAIPWDFALPSSCGVIAVPAFSPFLESIDVCQFQPMFHELMSVVWMLGGLFGAISLMMRSSLAD